MWKWFNCYLSGRHDFGVWCEPGAIFLRCMHCGKRSNGWSVDAKVVERATTRVAKLPPTSTPRGSRVLPFGRVAAR
jgi:hypothetical protein